MTGHIYLIGIGGIGMSALARWYNAHGFEVAGYDRQSTALTQALEREGIAVDHTGDPDGLPGGLQEDMAQGDTSRWTVVWTPAIPRDFPLIRAFEDAGFPLIKRAEALGTLTRKRPLIAIAGTHGKTTTSTLLTHLLHATGMPVEAFLGGIALGRESNLILEAGDSKAPWIVAEADEYDRSFLQLTPEKAAITSIEPDHLDIYGSHDKMVEAFIAFADQVNPGGLLLHADVEAHLRTRNGAPSAWQGAAVYGPLDGQDTLSAKGWQAGYSNVHGADGRARFTLHIAGLDDMDIHWHLPGAHNAANATAAAYLAVQAGTDPTKLSGALSSFPGVARRFQVHHSDDRLTIIDDYAHHPSEIAGTIAAARMAYPGQHLTGIFQPHLFSRTRDFMEEFAQALSALDQCVLLPIYAARENPMPGVDAQGIGDKMTGCPVECPPENRFLDVLEKLDPEVLLFMGAGDLDRWIGPAVDRLTTGDTHAQTDLP